LGKSDGRIDLDASANDNQHRRLFRSSRGVSSPLPSRRCVYVCFVRIRACIACVPFCEQINGVKEMRSYSQEVKGDGSIFALYTEIERHYLGVQRTWNLGSQSVCLVFCLVLGCVSVSNRCGHGRGRGRSRPVRGSSTDCTCSSWGCFCPSSCMRAL